jgi:hypothetical protein
MEALTDAMGYAASALVLATFCFSDLTRLRIFALLSNFAFIIFGYLGSIYPVMLLHMILLPINIFHLGKLLFPKRSPRSAVRCLLAKLRLSAQRELIRSNRPPLSF